MEEAPACVISHWSDKEKLTAAQIDCVMHTLKQWNIVEVRSIGYNPRWKSLSLTDPVFGCKVSSDFSAITYRGKYATFHDRRDDFDCTMRWNVAKYERPEDTSFLLPPYRERKE